MGLFGALVRTAVNVVTLPVSIAKDVVDLTDPDHEIGDHTKRKVEQIKREADEDGDDDE